MDTQNRWETRLPVQVLLLGGWTALWIFLDHVMAASSDRSRGLALGLGVMAVLGGGRLLAPARARALGCSLGFAALQLGFLAAVILLQGRGLSASGGPQVASLAMQAQGMTLLGSILEMVWARRPHRWSRTGFLLAHLSLALVVLGSLLGWVHGVRGWMELAPTEVRAGCQQMDGGRATGRFLAFPGFQVRLDRSDVLPAPPDHSLLALAGTGVPSAFSLHEGFSARLPRTDLRIRVERLLPSAIEAGTWEEDPQAPQEPALRVLLGVGTAEMPTGLLFARSPERWRREEPEGRFAVGYRERLDTALIATLRPRQPRAEVLVAQVRGHVLEHPLQVGGTWVTPHFRLTVKALFPDFAIRKEGGRTEPYSRSPEPLDPWLQAEIWVPGEEPKALLLSARHPEVTTPLNAPNLPPGLELRYERRDEEIQRRFVLFTRGDQRVHLVESGCVLRSEPLQLNRPFVVEPGLSVTPTARFEHAHYRPDFLPDPGTQGTVAFTRPAVKVVVTEASTGRSESRWLQAVGPEVDREPVALLGGKVGLLYRQKVQAPLDRPTELTMLDPRGEVLAHGTLGTHRAFSFRGYRFALAPDHGEGGDALRVMVVRDPGQPLRLLGGLLLVLGAVWMLLLKPMLKPKEVRA